MVLLDAESSRARRFLLPNERLVAEVRWHPIRLLWPVVGLIGVAIVAGWIAEQVPADSPLLDAAALMLLVAAAYVGWQVLEWWQERLIITDRRIMLGTGILTRKLAVMPLRKVTDMTYERSLLGRAFGRYGWGTFVMESAGQDQALHRIPHLPHPDVLYARLSTEIFGDRGLYGSSGGGDGDEPRRPRRRAPADDRDERVIRDDRVVRDDPRDRGGQRRRRPRPPYRDDPTMIIRLREDDD